MSLGEWKPRKGRKGQLMFKNKMIKGNDRKVKEG